ncbi:MAG: hypothetical protein LBD73_00905 [Deferribacteraceae bacterium]|jgi:hypothetical protein|nr:hypothetical protein [Deferribacteraceae bacterium]
MNYNRGFTLIHMAALIMILGIALIVTARHFSSSNVTVHVNRYGSEADNADRELRLFLSKYRYMPNYTSELEDDDCEDNTTVLPKASRRFMANNKTSTTPELWQALNPRKCFKMMYVAPIKDADWTGDVCATLPHTAAYTPNVIPPNKDYSVQVVYCEDNLTSSGECATTRMVLDNMIYAIAHPGDDGQFQSRITDNTLYVPAKGNDDLIRYLSIRDAYDLGDCAFRLAYIPKQDPRYQDYDYFDAGANEVAPLTRTWVTVEEHMIGGSDCTIGSGVGYSASIISTLGGADRYGKNDIPYSALQSCRSVHLEYPVNRLGETYSSELCCIQLNRNNLPDVFTSNCMLKTGTDASASCSIDEGLPLAGATPYININTNPFTTTLLGPVTSNLNQIPIPARLKITFRNGNRKYFIDDNATILRLERCINTRTTTGANPVTTCR